MRSSHLFLLAVTLIAAAVVVVLNLMQAA